MGCVSFNGYQWNNTGCRAPRMKRYHNSKQNIKQRLLLAHRTSSRQQNAGKVLLLLTVHVLPILSPQKAFFGAYSASSAPLSASQRSFEKVSTTRIVRQSAHICNSSLLYTAVPQLPSCMNGSGTLLWVTLIKKLPVHSHARYTLSCRLMWHTTVMLCTTVVLCVIVHGY